MTLEDVYKKLELSDKDCLVRKSDNWQDKVEFPSRIRRLLEKNEVLGAFDAFFCFDNKPLIMFYENPRDIDALHKAIWNFNEAPVIIVVEQSQVKIYNGFQLLKNSEQKRLEKLGDVDRLDDFSYFKLVTGETWQTYEKKMGKECRVDYFLLDNIEHAQQQLLQLGVERVVANALIGKIIFLRYLIDRDVKVHFPSKSDILDNGKLCRILSNKKMVWSLFDHLQDKDKGFNGDLFPLTKKQIYSVSNEAYKVLIRLLESEEIATGQRSLFDLYDFSVLPIEFISNVYEKFIGKKNQAKSGAYYTPTFLVDYLIRETISKVLDEHNGWECKVLDPACGSGIFLVEALRKMIEKYIQMTGNLKSDSRFKRALSDIVTKNIFGIDKDKSAVQVAIFSIYLTLLDYQDPADIERFKFPNLFGTNLICADAFDVENKSIRQLEVMSKNTAFDCIIGNPPWKRGGGGGDEFYLADKYLSMKRKSREYSGCKVAAKEISQVFLVRSLDFASETTRCALIVTSKNLYNRRAKSFRKFFLNKVFIDQAFELASVRREVFNSSNDSAIAPACILFFRNANGRDTNGHLVTHIALKPSLTFTLFKVFSLAGHDIQQVQQNRLKTYDWLWKILVYGSYLDFLFIWQLKDENGNIRKVIDDKTRFVYGTGIQFSKEAKCPAAHLKGRDFIDADAIDNFIVDGNKITKFKSDFVHRLRSQKKDIFEAPMLLCRKGLDSKNLTLRSAVSMRNLLFKDTLTAIKAYHMDDVTILRNIAGLGASDLFTYFAVNTFSSVGVEREQFHHNDLFEMPYCDGLADMVEEMEAQQHVNNDFWDNCGVVQKKMSSCVEKINSVVMAKWNVSKAEKDLIDYALTVVRPMIVIGHRAEKKLQKDDNLIRAYVNVFIERFAATFEDGINRFFYDTHVDEAWIGIRFYISSKPGCIRFSDKKWINFLDKIASGSITDQLFVKKDIRGFERNGFYIIKPNMYRLWHPAIARLDVEEFADAMMRAGGMK